MGRLKITVKPNNLYKKNSRGHSEQGYLDAIHKEGMMESGKSVFFTNIYTNFHFPFKVMNTASLI